MSAQLVHEWSVPHLPSSPSPSQPTPPLAPPTPRPLQSPGGDLGGPPGRSAAQKIVAFKEAFWKFLRPHTIRGTILGSSAVTAMALLESSSVRRQWRRRLGPPAGNSSGAGGGGCLPA